MIHPLIQSSCNFLRFLAQSANANMAPKQVILSTVWGFGVVYFIASLAYNSVQGGMLSDSFHHTMELLGVDA